ncbi:branched-chain amino acid aminotransferase [Arcanobacterium wilhelmae]|uniref:branched-chain-amino-acid transaminase n=1 Tax=Arcanobacterium wilhelmae TaxID=1803177 RepID=A0ABT9N9L1_9ACTO|nr:branched-chain amino acid aminotransferase [Arcanobacterium wilhelmae]MDP9800394.1 branched-chain amino acid aminotransferase [Arcanobacterium wilhelmae]WFN89824.1 branched-chain amino acid aminotransferase [Arcanobacterium wilhelmae]
MQEELENISARPIASADSLAQKFMFVQGQEASDDVVRELKANPGFGNAFADYMARATWTGQQWENPSVVPYGPISLDPAGSVLHYGQEIFEGLKAYRHEDGSVWTFRPTYNAARLNMSARRLAIPELPVEDFVASIVSVVRANERWVPSEMGTSLYLRPFTFASEAFLGVRAATKYEYMVVASPASAYFGDGVKAIDVWVDRTYHRAGPGGMGNVKTGGNYAASLLPKLVSHDAGFDEVLFLDAATNTNLDELGGMNVFVVYADGHVETPALSGNILPGATRSSILQLLRARGVDARETTISLQSVIDGVKSGDVAEMFACGTAAVVAPIGRLASDDFDVRLPGGDVVQSVYEELVGIQMGRVEDRFGWCYRIC